VTVSKEVGNSLFGSFGRVVNNGSVGRGDSKGIVGLCKTPGASVGLDAIVEGGIVVVPLGTLESFGSAENEYDDGDAVSSFVTR